MSRIKYSNVGAQHTIEKTAEHPKNEKTVYKIQKFYKKVRGFIMNNIMTFVIIFFAFQALCLAVTATLPPCYRREGMAQVIFLNNGLYTYYDKIVPLLDAHNKQMYYNRRSGRRQNLCQMDTWFENPHCNDVEIPIGTVPPAENFECDMRFGLDITGESIAAATGESCFCAGRSIYPNFGAWVLPNKTSPDDLDFYCLDSDQQLTNKMIELHDEVANEGYLITDTFYAERNRRWFMYPARKFGDRSQDLLTYYGHGKCLLVSSGAFCDGDCCQVFYNQEQVVEDKPWFRGQTNWVTDYMIVLDHTDMGDDMWNYLHDEVIPGVLKNIFFNSKIVCAVYNGEQQSEDDEHPYGLDIFKDENGTTHFYNNREIRAMLSEKFFNNRSKSTYANDRGENMDDILRYLETYLEWHQGFYTDKIQIVWISQFSLNATLTFEFERRYTKKLLSYIHVRNGPVNVDVTARLNSLYNLDKDKHLVMQLNAWTNHAVIPKTTQEPRDATKDMVQDFTAPIKDRRIVWTDEVYDRFERTEDTERENLISLSIGIKTAWSSGVVGFVIMADSFYDQNKDYNHQSLVAEAGFLDKFDYITIVRYFMSGVIYIIGFFVLAGFYYFVSVKWKQPNMNNTYFILIASFIFCCHKSWDIIFYDLDFFESSLPAWCISLGIILAYIALPLLALTLIGGYRKLRVKKDEVIQMQYQDLTLGFEVQNYIVKIGANYIGYVPRMLLAAGRIIAILGHSGAGKSQFSNFMLANPLQFANVNCDLNVYSWSDKFKSGVKAKVKNMIDLQQYIGFVPQFNIVPNFITVAEAVKIDVSQKYSFLKKYIYYVLKNLELLEHLDKFPHELSGGTLKRLSIAKTLVQMPPLMILDEPTSGLDSRTSLNLIKMLKEFCKFGFTIVMTIHQPSQEVLNIIDDVYIFCLFGKKMTGVKAPKDERVIDEILRTYKGKKVDSWGKDIVPPVWEADFLDDPERDFQETKTWGKLLKSLKRYAVTRKSSFITRFFSIFQRSALQELRNWRNVLVEFLVCYLAAISFILIFSSSMQFQGMSNDDYQECIKGKCGDIETADKEDGICASDAIENVCSYPRHSSVFNMLFSLSFCLAFVAMTSSLAWFASEKRLIRREARAGMNLLTYYLSKLFVKLPRTVYVTFVFLSISYTGVCLKGRFYEYFVVLYAVYLCVSGLGVCISLLYPDREDSAETVMIGVILLFVLMFLSAIFVTDLDTVDNGIGAFSKYLKYITFSYYSVKHLFTLETGTYIGQYYFTVVKQWQLYQFEYDVWSFIILYIFAAALLLVGFIQLFIFYSHTMDIWINNFKYLFETKRTSEKMSPSNMNELDIEIGEHVEKQVDEDYGDYEEEYYEEEVYIGEQEPVKKQSVGGGKKKVPPKVNRSSRKIPPKVNRLSRGSRKSFGSPVMLPTVELPSHTPKFE